MQYQTSNFRRQLATKRSIQIENLEIKRYSGRDKGCRWGSGLSVNSTQLRKELVILNISQITKIKTQKEKIRMEHPREVEQ